MESADRFNLSIAVNKWLELNCQRDEFLPEDVLQIKSDLLTSVDEILLEYQVSEKEAFEIACERMGSRFDWEGEMKQANEDNFQLKKVVLLFGGVIFYIFSYHFILSVNRLILLISNQINGNIGDNVAHAATYFNLVYFILIIGIVALYFWHTPVKWLFEKITKSTSTSVFSVIITILFVLLELYLVPEVRKSIENRAYITNFFNYESTFRYAYFGMFLFGFIVLFKKYAKINYI